jgi:hypothetical protein
LATDPLKNLTDAELQAELQRRHAEADLARRAQLETDLTPLREIGFGLDTPINVSVKQLYERLDAVRRTLPDEVSYEHVRAAGLTLRGLDSQVRMLLPEQPAVEPESEPTDEDPKDDGLD